VFKKIPIYSLLLGLTFYGCAGVSSAKMTEYRTTVGSTTLYDFQTLSEKILNQHRFFVDRTEEIGSGSTIETKYEYSRPTNEELIQGIKEIRYLIILEARRKGGGVGNAYTVRAIVRAYGRFTGNQEWVDIPINRDIKMRIKMFIADLKSETENKIRAF
jgi:hypothetical protein